MKTWIIIKGIALFFYHTIAPITFFAMLSTFIWGTEILNQPIKGHPSFIFFITLVPASMAISVKHYGFNDFMPNVATLIPKKYAGDEKSIKTWIRWVKKSKSIAEKKYIRLKQYDKELAEQSSAH